MLMVNIANGATELLKCGSILHLRARYGARCTDLQMTTNQAFHTICLLLRYGIQQVLIYPITRVERGSDKRYLISHSASIKR